MNGSPLECANVSINEVACYQTERALVGYVDPQIQAESAYPIGVFELRKNEKRVRHQYCWTYPANIRSLGSNCGGGTVYLNKCDGTIHRVHVRVNGGGKLA